MTLTQSIKTVIGDKYSTFSGRASRSEYWWYVLFNVFIATCLSGGVVWHGIWALFSFIPDIAVTVRRLHDVGKSGWWMLCGWIPVVGTIWLLYLLSQPSQPERNMYGEIPE